MDDILIKDALIVTCDPAHAIIKNGLITVSDGRITALESSDTVSVDSFRAKKTISANGLLLVVLQLRLFQFSMIGGGLWAYAMIARYITSYL